MPSARSRWIRLCSRPLTRRTCSPFITGLAVCSKSRVRNSTFCNPPPRTALNQSRVNICPRDPGGCRRNRACRRSPGPRCCRECAGSRRSPPPARRCASARGRRPRVEARQPAFAVQPFRALQGFLLPRDEVEVMLAPLLQSQHLVVHRAAAGDARARPGAAGTADAGPGMVFSLSLASWLLQTSTRACTPSRPFVCSNSPIRGPSGRLKRMAGSKPQVMMSMLCRAASIAACTASKAAWPLISGLMCTPARGG